ncbi:MAG: PHB depolymerase family esterase [Kofleriaceae bacterium]
MFLPIVFATLTQVTSFGSNPGALAMYEYVPANLPNNSPLVVVLHGCTQTASSMEEAGWNALADQYKFAVLYPQQQSANNPVECFNWAGEYGDTANLVRGQGENQSIMSMVDTEISTHHVDTNRVYIAGFSAGAAMTAVMAATWPDRFAGAAVMSGVAYRCATSVSEAYSCQSPGVTKTASAWGDLVRAASTVTKFPRVQLWQGTSDTTVAPANQTELVKQWTNVWGHDQTADETETLSGGTRTAYKVNGQVVVEAYSISGMSHAVVVGTDGGVTCPGTAGSYFEDHGICSTIRAATFFGLMGGGNGGGNGSGSGGGGGSGASQDGTLTVAFVSPADGDEVSGSVGIVIAANDTAGNVTGVEVSVDGTSIGSDAMAPYQFSWTAPTTPGSHTITATATDANGQTAVATATVTVGGGGSGSGSNADTGGGNQLPACSMNAGGAAGGWAPILLVLFVVIRRRS